MKRYLIVFIVVVLLGFGCDTNSGTTGNPKEVVDKFFTAMTARDMVTARKYATQESETMFNLIDMGMKMAPEKMNNQVIDKSRVEYGSAVINGDDATVPLKDKVSGETTQINLKKQNGSWKVAFDMNTLLNMGHTKMKEKGMTEEQINNMTNKVKDALETNPGLKQLMKDSIH